MSKKVGHWTDDEETLNEIANTSDTPWGIIVVFIVFVLPWLFGLGAIVGLLFFNEKF